MAYLYQGSQETDNVQKQDEQKQDTTMLTNATGDLGAEMAEGSVSGSSDRPKDMARSPALSTSQVLNRNLNKSGNPFQFDKTRQALAGSKGQVQSEYNTYMQNAVTPYQYGTQQQEQVRQYARGQAPSGQPDWLSRMQQGTPTGPGAFTSTAQTSFAPVNALKTNAGVRNFLRDPNDPEARSGEAAIDFSILNADPQFNINREQTLKDYEDLIKTKGDIEANAQAEARKAQLDAASKYRQGITSTLEEEAAALEKAAQEEETAYDRGFGSLDRNALARAEIQDLYNTGPENLRPYLGSGIGAEYDQFFNPLTGESTKPEDFITGEQAANFNRIMAALGREGKVAAKGRLAGQKGPGSEALQFDKQAFRNKVLNDAFARANAPSPFAGTDAYSAGPALAPLPPPAMPNPVAGTLAIPTDVPYVNPMDYAYSPVPEVQSPYMGNIMPGTLNIGYSHGGRVPGEAPTMGDSPANDVVSAKLSPGEIVIPRSSAMDKESAKQFIDNMPFSKTRDLLKNKYACGGMVENQYNCGGMVKKGYAEGGRVGEEVERQIDAQYNTPIPGAQEFKQGVDDALTKYVVDPLAERGYEDLGAGLATIPSTLIEATVPSTAGDALMAITPFPKIKGALKRGTSEFTPKAEPPKMPQFETVKKPYDEKMLDPAEQTVQKVLAALENENLTAEQKQALADFVRLRYNKNNYRSVQRLYQQSGMKEPDYDLAHSSFDYDYTHMNEDEFWDQLSRAFGAPQGTNKGRDPRVKKMLSILAEDAGFGARSTAGDRAKDLQYQMYKKGGR